MKHLACCVLSVGLCLSAMSSQANLTYGYTGNQFSNGSGNVTASVTFDSVIDNNFTGLVDINDIIAWNISSAPFSFNSSGPVTEPDATLFIPLMFEFSSGSIVRWDFAHNPGVGYDVYSLGESFVVGGGVSEDAAPSVFVTGNPGAWSVVPLPTGLALLTSVISALFAFFGRRTRRPTEAQA